MCDYWFATRSPSSIALACVVLAMDLRKDVSRRRRSEFFANVADVGMGNVANDEETGECYVRLREIHKAATGSDSSGVGEEEGEVKAESPDKAARKARTQGEARAATGPLMTAM